MTPFEIGSWKKGFTPTEWMGTRLNDGVPVNKSMCTLGFDSTRYVVSPLQLPV
jgi:lysophospholipase